MELFKLVALCASIAAATPVSFKTSGNTRIGIPTVNGRALARPGAIADAARDFSITQVAHKKFLKYGPAAYSRALQKYGVAIPVHVAAAVADGPPTYGPGSGSPTGETGSVEANPELYDEAYLSPVQIGTPPVTVNLDFDTGSADLWVFSSKLTAAEKAGHDVYNPNLSSTSRILNGSSWSIMYGDGSGARGDVYIDVVSIGNISAPTQAVEAATMISQSFVSDTESDGLVGLAFDSVNQVTPIPQKTFMSNVGARLSSNLFAVTLKHAEPGTYDFGYIDQSRYTDTIEYGAVDNSRGFWNFSAGTANAGSVALGDIGSAIADTGTSLILIDNSIARQYYLQVPGSGYSFSAGGYLIPCNATLPDFSITVNGVQRSTAGAYINYVSVTDEYCYGGIQSNQGLDFGILGDVFLKSQFVVFDYNGPRIGFAPQSA